jgi:hypothetical protein
MDANYIQLKETTTRLYKQEYQLGQPFMAPIYIDNRVHDLHIHTKGTNKNDNFDSADFDSFCDTLFRKALDKDKFSLILLDYLFFADRWFLVFWFGFVIGLIERLFVFGFLFLVMVFLMNIISTVLILIAFVTLFSEKHLIKI